MQVCYPFANVRASDYGNVTRMSHHFEQKDKATVCKLKTGTIHPF